jgi:hypothetical protein
MKQPEEYSFRHPKMEGCLKQWRDRMALGHGMSETRADIMAAAVILFLASPEAEQLRIKLPEGEKNENQESGNTGVFGNTESGDTGNVESGTGMRSE